MRLLLDTNALFWWGQDNKRLPAHVRERLTDPGVTTFYTMVSLWEAALKTRSRGLSNDVGKIARQADAGGLELLPIRLDHVEALLRVPRHHQDPFDHLIIAQAMVEDATIISSDRMFPRYPIDVISI